MRCILIGNGFNIQFDKDNYTNRSIIKRIIHNCNKGHNSDIYPMEIVLYLYELVKILKEILNGELSSNFITSDEKQAKLYLLEKYNNNSIDVYNIGIEDYIILHHIACRKTKMKNPEKYYIFQQLKFSIIDAIYNYDKINGLYINYSEELKKYVNAFDYIFTVNYDTNLDSIYSNSIFHLHGCFVNLSDDYDYNSFKNKHVNKNNDLSFIKGREYLFSTALLDFSGESKEFAINMNTNANEGISKFAKGIKEETLTEWENSDNKLVRNLAKGIRANIQTGELSKIHYPIKEFKVIKGSIIILGLSPFNDRHIFKMIDTNDEIEEVIYYYYDISEMKKVRQLLEHKKTKFLDAHDFWKENNLI